MSHFNFMTGNEYRVLYSNDLLLGSSVSDMTRVKVFVGEVENFNPNGQCAFRNEDGLYIIHYKSILSLEPVVNNKTEKKA